MNRLVWNNELAILCCEGTSAELDPNDENPEEKAWVEAWVVVCPNENACFVSSVILDFPANADELVWDTSVQFNCET